MNFGRLNRRISFRNQTATQDEYGGQVQTWSTVLECWARVEPLNGKEWFTARQHASEVDTRFTIRYTTVDITPTSLLVYNDKEYNITSIIEVDDKRERMEIMAYKVTT